MATVLKFPIHEDTIPVPPAPMPSKCWYSAQELADLGLRGLPKSKRKINELADRDQWRFRVAADGSALCRQRLGRGGGNEFHLDLLPPAARAQLIGTAELVAHEDAVDDAGQWRWFEQQSDKVKDEARARLAIIDEISVFEASGMTRTAAMATAAGRHGVSTASIRNWTAAIAGIPAADRLPHLASRRVGGGKECEIDPQLWTALLSDYLRPEKPTFSSVFWRIKRMAEANGLTIPHERSLRRKLEREVDRRLIVAQRDGMDALRATIPPQQRTVEGLHALDLVNIDGHRWDVFVKHPSEDRAIRPVMVAIQDVFSRKILAWRIGETESVTLTRLAFADLFQNFGIPGACLLDNGRAFASKQVTGGSKTRFRFKIREEEPTGFLTALGIRTHWAKPYRGSSKPIERAFRDLCDSVAKHPALAGAYTGNKPDAKPENYGSRAVAFDLFEAVVASGIAAHNARIGRRTETANGGSFDTAFDASYSEAAIRKATPEQLRLALLAADEVSTDRKSGAISLYGNRYWSEALSQIAGERVTVRFDPDRLHGEIHVYARDGRFIASAPVWEASGFLDEDAAKTRARQESQLRKATKRQRELQQLITMADLAAMQPETPAPAASQARVVRPVRPSIRNGGAALKAVEADHSSAPAMPIDRLAGIAARLRAVD